MGAEPSCPCTAAAALDGKELCSPCSLLFNGLAFVAEDELGTTAGDPLSSVFSTTSSRVREGDTPLLWLCFLVVVVLVVVVVWLL